MEFASFEANRGGGQGLLVYPILFSFPLSGRIPDITEILLTGTFRLKSVKTILGLIF